MNRRGAAVALGHFEGWVRLDEMRGSMHPDDRDDIHARYLEARERMIKHLTGENNG